MLAEVERFVNWVRRRSPDAHTWRDYRCDLNFFLASVGDRPPREITFRDIDQFISEQSERGFKPATINRRLASIASLYAFLMPEDDDLACPVHPRRLIHREELFLLVCRDEGQDTGDKGSDEVHVPRQQSKRAVFGFGNQFQNFGI